MKAFLICNLEANKSPFLDNLIGECSVCKNKVQYRPHAPKDTIKTCLACFEKTHFGKEEAKIEISKESIKELKNLNKN